MYLDPRELRHWPHLWPPFLQLGHLDPGGLYQVREDKRTPVRILQAGEGNDPAGHR